jgi:hypothetical protein
MEKLPQVDYTRQLDWFNPADHPDLRVTVVGAGGIGGPTCIALAKLGVRSLRVYDFDRVEVHNQPNQVYGLTHLNARKVDALAHICRLLADCSLDTRPTRLHKGTPLKGIIIGAVDSMDARRSIWSAVLAAGPSVSCYIDGRIGGEVIRVLTVRPNNRLDRAKYQRSIVPTHAVAPLRCTAAGIIDVSFAVASLITRSLRLSINKPMYSDLFYDHRNLMFQKG